MHLVGFTLENQARLDAPAIYVANLPIRTALEKGNNAKNYASFHRDRNISLHPFTLHYLHFPKAHTTSLK